MGFDCDVLIAGGGPTGVTLAILLAKRGVSVIVAEKEAGIYPLPRAAHIDHEGMRILQDAGVAHGVMATARRASCYEFRNASGEILLRFEGSDKIGPGGWPAANMIHQPSVEAELRRALENCQHATFNGQWSLNGFVADDTGVTASIETAAGRRSIRARYLVGADGARSPVREAAGIAFDDLDFEEPWLVVDMLVDDPSRLPRENLQICNPERPTTCILMSEGRHRWEFMLLPGETPEQVSDDAFIETLLAPWHVAGAVRLERKAVYTFQARVASPWRRKRVLLAGDAAHQTPPFAGQGMCSGLRDAANLAWKLAAVIRNGADDALLDSYQTEREPNLRATIQMAIMMGRTVCITDPEAAAQRDARMIAARASGQSPDGNLSYPSLENGIIMAGSPAAGSYFPQFIAEDGNRIDDRLGPEGWLLDRAALSAPALAPFAPWLSSWFDRQGVEAVLVRPDRHVFGTGSPATLLAAWQAVTGKAPLRTPE